MAYEYRLLSTPQYLLLFNGESKDGIYRRLQRLFHHGYLDRLGNNPNAPLVYALGRRGAEILEVQSPSCVAEPYLRHRLMVGNFRIALTLACRELVIDLTWRGPADLPVRPDGFFTLCFPDRPDGRNRAHFFLEADRSTMSRERFVGKLKAYWEWYLEGGHTKTLGIKNFRVLTVTKSEERTASLLRALASAEALRVGLGRFWFTSERRFTSDQPGSIFGAIWETPGAERQNLLP